MISSSSVPRGVRSVTTSPTEAFKSAVAMGEIHDTRPRAGSSSSTPTMLKVRSAPFPSATVTVAPKYTRSCSFPVSAAAGKTITTIEGLAKDASHPVQQAWLEIDVPQCGYCQSGQIMAAVAFLEKNPKPTDADIDKGMSNICRCGTYPRIKKAIHRAAELMAAGHKA